MNYFSAQKNVAMRLCFLYNELNPIERRKYMAVVKAIFSNFGAFLMAIIMILIPTNGIELPILNTSEENCLLNVELISDTHIEEKEMLRYAFLEIGLKNLKRSKAPVDALVVTGDLTNYADEPALARFYEAVRNNFDGQAIIAAGNHDIGHVGDRDVTNITREQAKANVIKYYNDYSGRDLSTNYYSETVNGYKFIVLGDDVVNGGHWDEMDMTPEQLEFLDAELADGTKDGKPAFVCCHWPVDHINGQDTIWPDSGIDLSINDVKSIMEKYPNVYYISGHMHAGIKSSAYGEMYGLKTAEQVNGVTYISLPTYGIVNMFGNPLSGTGAQLEVYADKVVFRPRNFLTGKWYTNSNYEFEIVK